MIIFKLIHLTTAIFSIFIFKYKNDRKNAHMLFELQQLRSGGSDPETLYKRQRAERIKVYFIALVASMLSSSYLIFFL